MPWIIEGGFAVAVLVFMWKISAESNAKAATLFRRFDEFKVYIEQRMKDDYVSKEMCKLMREHGESDFLRLERKVDEGFRSINKQSSDLMKVNK